MAPLELEVLLALELPWEPELLLLDEELLGDPLLDVLEELLLTLEAEPLEAEPPLPLELLLPLEAEPPLPLELLLPLGPAPPEPPADPAPPVGPWECGEEQA